MWIECIFTNFAIDINPQDAVACKGVQPSLSPRFISAPCSTRNSTMSKSSSMHACGRVEWNKKGNSSTRLRSHNWSKRKKTLCHWSSNFWMFFFCSRRLVLLNHRYIFFRAPFLKTHELNRAHLNPELSVTSFESFSTSKFCCRLSDCSQKNKPSVTTPMKEHIRPEATSNTSL